MKRRPRTRICFQLTVVAFTLLLSWSASSISWAESVTVELDVAVDRKAPIGTAQRWQHRFKSLQNTRTRFHTTDRMVAPRIDIAKTRTRTTYKVFATISADDTLHLPHKKITRRNLNQLREYLDSLRKNGPASVSSSRGPFGLSNKQFTKALAELATPIPFSTKSLTEGEFLRRLTDWLDMPLEQGSLATTLQQRRNQELSFDAKGIATGTALAVYLGHHGLAMRPELSSGKLQLVVIRNPQPSLSAGNADEAGSLQSWPVGWQPLQAPGRIAPDLFKVVPAQVSGFRLEAAITAIDKRLPLSILWDEAALATLKQNPRAKVVDIPPGRMSFDRALSRMLFQAGLKGEVRIDDGERPFYWITSIRRPKS